jgi:ubiquitin-like modifier-activating enzyme ATG7
VKKALNEKGWVEEVSGLAEVQRRAEELEKEIEFDELDGDEDGELL